MYLGIDLGTSELKALLVDEAGAALAAAGVPLSISRPQPQWSEQHPEEWWQAALQAIDRLRQSHAAALSAVRGIGLSGQMHGATLLDRADQVIRPAILWNDMRCGPQCADLTSRLPALPSISGNLAMPGFTAPKLLWVGEHEPGSFERLATVLLPKDYLRLRLTGEKVSDMSDASGTLWLDVAARAWSQELLAATGLATHHMPRLVEGDAVSGELRPELAQRWGMRQPVVVAGGAGDNAASAIGLGAVSPGEGFVSLGTSGVIFVVNDRFRPSPASAVHAFCHAIPDRWHQMSVMLSAASCLKWAVQLAHARDEAELLAAAASVSGDSRRRAPIFLPYLSGERTPHNDPRAQGVLFGVTHDTDRAALGYAVAEGVAFGLADGLHALAMTGQAMGSLALVGGGARSDFWAQLIATILDVPIRTPAGAQTAAALGAARLAQLACGRAPTEVCLEPAMQKEFLPQLQPQPLLRERLDRFRALYAATRTLFD